MAVTVTEGDDSVFITLSQAPPTTVFLDVAEIGPQGPIGFTGAPGLVHTGAWSAGTAYAVNNSVTHLGSTYRRKVAGTTATAPASDTTNWELLAGKGDPGVITSVNGLSASSITLTSAHVGAVATIAAATSGVTNARRVTNLVTYSSDTGNVGNSLVIVTNIGSTSTLMTSLKIRGYNYLSGTNVIDLDVGFYPHSSGYLAYGAINNGTFPITQVRLMTRVVGGVVAIVIDSSSLWQYVKVTVDGIFGLSSSADSVYQGWFITQTSDLTGYLAGVAMAPVNYVDDVKAQLITGSKTFNGTTTFNGAVNGLTKTQVGLSNVDNTADTAKPVSTAQQTALNLKANLASPTFTGTVSGITKAMVGLTNVDDTSDANKPVSTAQQNALNLKANLASPTFTGTVSGITNTMVGAAATVHGHALTDANITGIIPDAQIPSPLRAALSSSSISGSTGADNLAVSGWYDWQVTTGSPTGAAGIVHNYYYSGTYGRQVFYAYNAAGIWTRQRNNSATWTAWEQIVEAAALALKAPIASPTFTGTVSGITKTMVGLANVDNTADTAKPVSTAQQTALNLKANLDSPTFTGTVSGITKTHVGLANVDNTADSAKPVSTAQQNALNLKANLASPTFSGTVSGITNTMVGAAATVHGHALTDANITGIIPDAQLPTRLQDATLNTKYINQIETGVGDFKRVRDLVKWDYTLGGVAGYLVIQTNLVAANNMINLSISGYNYTEWQATIGAEVSFYAQPGPTWPYSGMSAMSTGDFIITRIRLMRRASDNKIAIALESGNSGIWDYTKIAVDGIFGFVSVADTQFEGWTVTIEPNLALYLGETIVPITVSSPAHIHDDRYYTETESDAKYPFKSNNLSDLTNATTARTNLVLGNVDNTSDANKPISTATQSALNLKAPSASPTFTGTVSGITATMVGLGNVNNTADSAKPVSTAQQSALDLKANLAGANTFSGGGSSIGLGPGSQDHVYLSWYPRTATPTTRGAYAGFGGTGSNVFTIANEVSGGQITLSTVAGPIVLNPGNAVATINAAVTATSFTGSGAALTGLTKSQVGLANVDNTTDVAKPVSTAQQSALDLKANLASPTFTGTVSGITKTMVGLANVDNTADSAKPVSTAQQSALDLKAPLASPAFTGTPTGITKTHVGLANVDNTTDAAKPVSTAQQSALNLKANLASPTFTGTVSGITNTMVGAAATVHGHALTDANITGIIPDAQLPTRLQDATLDVKYINSIEGGTTTTFRRARGLLKYENSTANIAGSLIIQTNIVAANNMMRLFITGYNFLSSNGIIDLDIGFYATSAPTYTAMSAVDNGDFPVAQVRLMRRTSDNKVAIIIDSGAPSAVWQYPKIAIDGIFGHQLVPDASLQGWTASISTDLTAYTVMNTMPLVRPSVSTHGHALTDAAITGVLALAKGGTGNASGALAPGGVITAASATAMGSTAAGTAGQFLRSAGAGTPTWAAPTTAEVSGLDTALAAKAPLASPAFTGTPTGITKTHVGLANVDNTADTAKPVSTAQQTALNLKANLAGAAFTGAVTTTASANSLNVQRFIFTTAGQARPTGTAYVEWVGPVSPTNAIDGDTWVNTT